MHKALLLFAKIHKIRESNDAQILKMYIYTYVLIVTYIDKIPTCRRIIILHVIGRTVNCNIQMGSLAFGKWLLQLGFSRRSND